MARARKSGDEAWNARRREFRAAQRYLKKSQEGVGETAAQNRALAKLHLENAIATYDPTQKQRISSQIVNLAAEFGIDVQSSRGIPQYMDTSQAKREIESKMRKREKAIRKSKTALESVLSEQRRELEAQALISNKQIGKRIMGGLVDVWRDSVKKDASAAENRAAAEKAVFDYFKVDNWADVLDKLRQSMGNDLFSTASDNEIYDVVRIALQSAVIKGTFVK